MAFCSKCDALRAQLRLKCAIIEEQAEEIEQLQAQLHLQFAFFEALSEAVMGRDRTIDELRDEVARLRVS